MAVDITSASQQVGFTFKWNINNIFNNVVRPVAYTHSAQLEFDLCTNIHFIGNFSISRLPGHDYKLVVELKSTTHREWNVKCTALRDSKMQVKGNFDQSMFSREFIFTEPNYFSFLEFKIYHLANKSTVMPICTCKESKFKHEFSQFLETKQFADVLFKVAGEEIHGHKIILAQYSPVFKTMFENQMKDDLKNELIIDNMDPTVFKEMLRFMYLGEVSNLKIFAAKLLPISIDYDLPRLKSICEKELAANITIENMVEVLSLAELHKAEELKEQAINFMKDNVKPSF